MKVINADNLIEKICNRNTYLDFDEAGDVIKFINNAPAVELRLMQTEECAGHPIEYAMGWKACIDWLKSNLENPGGNKE